MAERPASLPVDIIVPVAGAAEDFARCAASLGLATDFVRHRLVVVLDGEPRGDEAAAIEAALAGLKAVPTRAIEVLVNPERRGFVASVNRGMALSDRDVILLNSDTVVTPRWVEKMQEAACSSPEVATVTPFSNHATICSLPEPLGENAVPAGYTIDSFARLIEERSLRAYPRLPTGVGFCLYVKRRALDELGPFDEAAFGAGYGEEVDFCLRAAGRGFVHLLDDATFVYHAGQKSFGRRRKRRVEAGHRVIRRRHPDFFPALARFLAADPLAPLRRRVIEALAPPRASRRPPATILHLVHGWPPYNSAGTEGYARSLALRQAARREVFAYTRLADRGREHGDAIALFDHGVRVRLAVNNFEQRNPLARNALHDPVLARDFGRFLERARPALAHVHHLAGHGLSLLAMLARRRIPIVFQAQDWWMLCARANLLDRERHSCSGPGAGKCSACLPMTGLPAAGLWNPLLYALRNRWARRLLQRSSAVVMGSEFIAQSLSRHGLLDGLPEVHVLPYGVELPGTPPRRPAVARHLPLRFGCIGSMQPHKGLHLAVAAFRGISPAQASLDIWGDPAADPAYARELQELAAGAPVAFHGRFAEEEKAGLLAGLDALIVPSLGLESFGLVAREAMACGTPVLLARGSALAELASELPAEASFPPGDAAELRARLDVLIERPETLAEWARRLPPVKGMDAHAEEIEGVYERVLSRAETP